jgi:hypothetical protein
MDSITSLLSGGNSSNFSVSIGNNPSTLLRVTLFDDSLSQSHLSLIFTPNSELPIISLSSTDQSVTNS